MPASSPESFNRSWALLTECLPTSSFEDEGAMERLDRLLVCQVKCVPND
jgi:hypothetical protein